MAFGIMPMLECKKSDLTFQGKQEFSEPIKQINPTKTDFRVKSY